MKRLYLSLLIFALQTASLTGQGSAVDILFRDNGQSRQQIIESNYPVLNAELYPDELYLLEDKARFAGLKSLTIKERYYGETLAFLPWSIVSLDSLTRFRIEGVRSLDWPSAYSVLAALPNLSALSINGCPGCAIPQLAALQNLRKLEIGSVYEGSLDAVWMLTSLRHLDLRTCGLKSLPDAANNLTQLTWMDLSFNSIETFPATLSGLTHLTWLDLTWNALKEFPRSILDLSALEGLEMTHNKIHHLPDSLWKLRSLKTLRMPWNRLHELPDSIGRMDSLRELDISMNCIKRLPATLLKCDRLNRLYCWSPRFRENSPVLKLFVLSAHLRCSEKRWMDTIAHYSKIIPGWKTVFPGEETVATRREFRQDVLIENLNYYDATPNIAPLYFQPDNLIDIDEFARWRERKNPVYEAATTAEIWFDYPIFPFGYRRMTNLTEVEIVVNEPWMLSKRLLRPLTKCKDLAIIRIDDPYIRKVPPVIRKMKNLEVLELECGGIKELPEWLAELPKLREIRIYKNVVVPAKLERKVKIKYF
ncbi:MAG TPA: leucine-rich repeat domain-containing protein [Bacteroidia bacterium]|nr:leucine-rich repeat domain-containing protein [Bacteroidia bacterium]